MRDNLPLLVTLKDSVQVKTVLREARKFEGNDTFSGVFSPRDCAPSERAEMRK